MKRMLKKSAAVALSIAVLAFGVGSAASAHVTVKPAEAVTAGYQTFTVNVPNEKEIPTVSVKVLIPESIASATPTQKAGWQVTKETAGEGEATVTKSITWSGNEIGNGLRDEFSFSAKVPSEAGELQWKAYQTYSDGTVVAWDKADEGGHGHGDENSGPFSVTKVVAQSSQDAAVQKADETAAAAARNATLALSLGAVGVVLGLVAVYLATRKK